MVDSSFGDISNNMDFFLGGGDTLYNLLFKTTNISSFYKVYLVLNARNSYKYGLKYWYYTGREKC